MEETQGKPFYDPLNFDYHCFHNYMNPRLFFKKEKKIDIPTIQKLK